MSNDPYDLILDSLTSVLDEYREEVRRNPSAYLKDTWSGQRSRNRVASQIRALRRAIAVTYDNQRAARRVAA